MYISMCTIFSLMQFIFSLRVQKLILNVALSCSSLTFHCCIIFYSVNTAQIIYSFLHQKHLGCFQIGYFPGAESIAINIVVKVSKCPGLNYQQKGWVMVYINFEFYRQSFIELYFHQQCRKDYIDLQPLQFLAF